MNYTSWHPWLFVYYWHGDKLGLSLELGSFVAGVMISTTDFAQHTLEQVEAIRNLFAALFLASIGMLIHVQFLWNHVDILLAAVILVIIIKTIVVTIVVKAFRYSIRTAFVVGLSLAQIGEFAFVLLSRASHLKLVEDRATMLDVYNSEIRVRKRLYYDSHLYEGKDCSKLRLQELPMYYIAY
ncbi:K(+) efflux antiporter 5 [Ananas comosus]|uniref:K(+) efflux antiporter 5 n=1 Tax=Ananas comosus TaxID=4615 RepID=A0A199W5Q9_ANACO|nr:K(+) efflux antiporter 5 [Ananas comosus]